MELCQEQSVTVLSSSGTLVRTRQQVFDEFDCLIQIIGAQARPPSTATTASTA
jgi:hypothetical protein